MLFIEAISTTVFRKSTHDSIALSIPNHMLMSIVGVRDVRLSTAEMSLLLFGG